MKKLLLATSNPGKFNEIKKYLSDLPIEVVSLQDLNITEKVEEIGQTFKENAILKARFYFKKSNLPTLADDGGFEIDYLNGEPGVKSHRWLGYEMSDQELIEETLRRLEGVKKLDRGAQIRAVTALALPNDEVYTSEGVIKGFITDEVKTKIIPGYPFRSIFYITEFNKVLADLTEEEHQKINHRLKAINELKPHIIKLINQ